MLLICGAAALLLDSSLVGGVTAETAVSTSSITYSIPNLGAFSLVTAGAFFTTPGYGAIIPDSGKRVPAAGAIWAAGSSGMQSGMPATPASLNVRMHAETGPAGPFNT